MNTRMRNLKRFYSMLTKTVIPEAPFEYYENDATSGNITTYKYLGDSSSVTIPRQIDSHSVTEVGTFTFCDNSTITNVVIQDGVTKIT